MPPPPVLPCDELRHLYEREQLTTLQIAARYACSATTAANWLRRCGIVLRDARYQPRTIPLDALEQLYVDEQQPIKAIAQHFGVSVGTIYNRLRAYQIPSRKKAARLLKLVSESRLDYQSGDERRRTNDQPPQLRPSSLVVRLRAAFIAQGGAL